MSGLSLSEHVIFNTQCNLRFIQLISAFPLTNNQMNSAIQQIASYPDLLSKVLHLLKKDEQYPLSYLKKIKGELFLEEMQKLFYYGDELYMGLTDPYKKLVSEIEIILAQAKKPCSNKQVAFVILPGALSAQATQYLASLKLNKVSSFFNQPTKVSQFQENQNATTSLSRGIE